MTARDAMAQPALSPPVARTALLLGATGLVGRHCLDRLLADPACAAVTTLGRRALGQAHPKLTHHVVDFDDLPAHAARFAVHDVYCCLGTTIRQAGSQAAFRKVDFTYPYEAARLASAAGVEQYLLVSALGADARSRVFYNRVKGEVEDAVAALRFYGCYLFRPSLLTGERPERRQGAKVFEAILEGLSPLLQGRLRKYRPIAGATVARALVAVAAARKGGVRRYASDEIAGLGR
jgi:uncharacterized protein YbjT (DUF2867 family)